MSNEDESLSESAISKKKSSIDSEELDEVKEM